MNDNLNSTRIDYIDIAKGIGIIFVIIGHNISPDTIILKFIYSFHMPLFFFIAGYLFEKKQYHTRPIKSILKTRLQGIIYPYLTLSVFNLILYFILSLFFTKYINEPLKIITLTLSTFGYHSLWFLPTFAISTLIFLVVKKIKIKANISIFVLIFLSLLLWFINAKISTANSIFWSGSLWYLSVYFGRLCSSIIFISIGYLFSYVYTKYIIKFCNMTIYLCVILLSIVFLAIFDFNKINNDYNNVNMSANEIGNPILFIFIGILGSIIILLFSQHFIKHNKFLQYFGKNSILYMVLHMDLSYIIINAILYNVNYANDILNSCFISILNIIITSFTVIVFNKYLKFFISIPNISRRKE